MKMKGCYEFFVLGSSSVSHGGKSTQERTFIEIHPDHEETFNNFLKAFGKSSFGLLNTLSRSFQKDGSVPWALIFFEREFQIAGHVLSVREIKSEISFSALSIVGPGKYSIEEQGVPPVGFLMIENKSALEKAARESELFRMGWELLTDKSEGRKWICIAESPSNQWVDENSEGDDELFLELFKTNK